MVKNCSIASDSWLDFLPRNCGTVIPQWNSNAFPYIDTPKMPIDKGFHLARADGMRAHARRRAHAGIGMIVNFKFRIRFYKFILIYEESIEYPDSL